MTHPTTEYRLRAMLIIAREQFQRYGDLHMDKQPPQHAKARANYDLVREINDTLLNAHTLPVDFDGAFDALVNTASEPSQQLFDEEGFLVPQPSVLTSEAGTTEGLV